MIIIWNFVKVPAGLFPSGDLVMSINNPNLGSSEEGRAPASGMAGTEESLTPHEFRERNSSSRPGGRCNCGQLSESQGKTLNCTCACWIFLVWGVDPFASLLFHRVRAMKRIRGGFLKRSMVQSRAGNWAHVEEDQRHGIISFQKHEA